MVCANCGISLNESDKFCYNCGKSVAIKPNYNNVQQNVYNNQAPQQQKVGPDINVQEVKMCKFAITSFILSFIVLFGSIPSIIFSIISLKRIKKQKLKGRGLALSGLIISCVLIFFAILIYSVYQISSPYGASSQDGGITFLFR